MVLSGEKPTALEGKEGEKEGGSTTSKLYGALSAGGSTSRLDHMSTKTGIPGSKPSQMEHTPNVSLSQPNLHRIPGRSKSDPRMVHRMQQKDQRKDSITEPPEDTGTQKSPSLPRRMLKQPSTTSIPSSNGRLTPTELGTSGRATPSKLSRPSSRLTRPGTLSTEGRVVSKELPSDEKESDCTFRRRSSSETKKTIGSPRNLMRTPGESCGIPGPGGLVGGARPHQKSATLSPDTRVQSSSVPSGDESKRPPERQKSNSSSDSGPTTPTVAASPDAMKRGLQPPSQRKLRALGPTSLASKTAPNKKTDTGEESKRDVTSTSQKESEGSGGRKKTDPPSSEKEKTSPSHSLGGMSKLAKPTSLQRPGSGGTSPGEIRKSPLPPSGLSKLQLLSSSQGLISGPRGSKVTRVDLSGRERPMKGGRKETNSSNSSLESAVNSELETTRPSVKLEKLVSSTSTTGSSTTTETEKPKAVLQELPLNKTSPTTPLAGGKDNRRISPEGMAPEGQTLSNESSPTATETHRNSINLQDKPVGNMKTKLIEEVGGKFKNGPTDLGERGADGTPDKIAATRENGESASKIGGAIEVGVASESEIQTPNLSQGSEVATDSTLSSLSIASVSSPPHSSIPSLASYSQQPETGQAPYANSHGAKHSSLLSHAHHMTEKTTETEIQDPPQSRHYSPAHPHHHLRSPLKKEKAKRARSLSPKTSRRIFPLPPAQPSPSVNVSQYDANNTSSSAAQPSPVNSSFVQLTRTDSPESVKSDVSLSRKPLRSSLRNTRDKDSSSSSVDSGKVLGSKVTISPRSSQVIYFKDEAGLQVSMAHSQPTNLSPAKRMTRGRPSSLSDNISVNSEGDKRDSLASEQLDLSETETFLSKRLAPTSHHRYDSTPEVCRVGGASLVQTSWSQNECPD